MRKIAVPTQGRLRAEPGEADERLFVNAAVKALAVLEAFYDERGSLSLTEIGNRTGIGRSAAQRFVHTLKALGYLRQDEMTRRYTLTPRVLNFAHAYLRNDPLISMAFPYLSEANRRSGETVNLTRLDGHEVMFLARFPSSTIISADLVIGSRLPVFCTAPGRAMLAHRDIRTARAVLTEHPREPRTPHTITDLDTLLERLAAARRNGFELAVEESFLGDLSIAAPILRGDGTAIAAVNIAVATPRWTVDAALGTLVPIVRETAQAISAAAGSRQV